MADRKKIEQRSHHHTGRISDISKVYCWIIVQAWQKTEVALSNSPKKAKQNKPKQNDIISLYCKGMYRENRLISTITDGEIFMLRYFIPLYFLRFYFL